MACILIIDDDEASAANLAEMLRELDHEAVPLRDPGGAQNALDTGAQALVIDIADGDLDAFAFVRKLKGLTPDIRVCAYASRATKNDLVAAIRAGFDDWLDKPATSEEVRGALARMLSPDAADSSADAAATETGEEEKGSSVDDIIQMLRSGTIDLPQMPSVARELRSLLGDAEVSPEAIVSLLEQDPSVAARVLSYGNSAAHGASVNSLRQAVFRLGTGSVRSLVETAALAATFTAPTRALEARFRSMWQSCVLSASASRLLAKEVGVDPEEAYLAALFRDVGELFLLGVMAKVDADAVDESMAQLASLHPKFSASLLARWGLHAEFQAVARLHHAAAYEGGTRRLELLNVVHIAEHLLHDHAPALCGHPPDGPGLEAATSALKLQEGTYERLLDAMTDIEADALAIAG